MLLRHIGVPTLRDLRKPVAISREVPYPDQSSVVIRVPGGTESITKLSSDSAEQSGAMRRRSA